MSIELENEANRLKNQGMKKNQIMESLILVGYKQIDISHVLESMNFNPSKKVHKKIRELPFSFKLFGVLEAANIYMLLANFIFFFTILDENLGRALEVAYSSALMMNVLFVIALGLLYLVAFTIFYSNKYLNVKAAFKLGMKRGVFLSGTLFFSTYLNFTLINIASKLFDHYSVKVPFYFLNHNSYMVYILISVPLLTILMGSLYGLIKFVVKDSELERRQKTSSEDVFNSGKDLIKLIKKGSKTHMNTKKCSSCGMSLALNARRCKVCKRRV